MPEVKLFLIDAHALCYRSFHAITKLSTSKGQATNAIFGFVRTLRKILKDYQPEYMAVCFDSAAKTHRQEKFAEYKIHRPAMPDDLISQIPVIKEIVKAFHWGMTFEVDGFEADDIIATLSKQVAQKALDVIIVSEDKDMYQLVNKKVKFYSTSKDVLLGHKDIKQRLGFDPYQIADFIGLAGDKADNIPGVAGIGEVTARNLINRYGDLENILKNIEKVKPPQVKEKLAQQKETAELSRELAVLETNVPINFDLTKMKVKEPDRKRLFEMFKELEFKGLAQEFSVDEQEGKHVKVHSCQSKSEIQSLIAQIQDKGRVTFLIDSSEGDNLYRSEQLLLSLGDRDVFSIPLKQSGHLKEVFEDKGILKITQNLKSALKHLSEQGLNIEGPVFDVMLAGYLLGSSQYAFQMDHLAWDYLKISFTGKERMTKGALVVSQLYPLLLKELKDRSLLKLLEEIEIPLSAVLFKMEHQGVNLDLKLLNDLSKNCEKEIQKLTAQLYKQAGQEFNLNSPKQLSQILFEKLKLPVIKKTKTGFSTDERVLTKLALNHDFPAFILEFRQLAKLKSTYIDALPKLIDPKTGRVHAQFDQTGTETGRLSSRHPNLQNIPIRTELGREIRRAIIPSKKNHLLIAADYSQIELRILAHLSQDRNLIKAFQTNQDIHQFTASLIFDVQEEKVTAQMRDSAKRVNFGIIYGMSAFGLAKDLNISQEEAQEFIDKYFLRYPEVKKFMDNEIKKCEEKGYVMTLLNRRRYIPEIHSQNISMRQFAQRQAINTPVQGSAADLMKLAMINIQQELDKQKLHSKMIITVHDELVFDVPQDEKNTVADLTRENMEHPLELTVPIKVSIKAGSNWLDMKDI